MPSLGKKFRTYGGGATLGRTFSTGTFFARMRRAHTLVELAVALAIISVAAALGWGTLEHRLATQRMLRGARMLSGDLAMLRTIAIDHSRESRLVLIEADGALDPDDVQHGAWRLQVGNKPAGSDEWDTLPMDVGGVVDESDGIRSLEPGGETELRGISLAQWSPLDSDAIRFSPRGWVDNPAGDFSGGYLTLELVNKQKGGERVVLRIARSGMVRVEVSESTALPGTTVGNSATSAQ